MADFEEVCAGNCGKPILPGQPRYTGQEFGNNPKFWHWECHEKRRAEFDSAMKKLPETAKRVQRLLDDLRRKIE